MYLCFLNSGGLALPKGLLLGFGVGALWTVCFMSEMWILSGWWDVMAADPRARCGDAWTMWTLLNYVVNTFKQKFLMTTLAAGLFLWGSYLCPSGLKCGTIFQRDSQKVPQQTSEVCKWSVAPFQGRKTSLCWGTGKEKPQVFLHASGK